MLRVIKDKITGWIASVIVGLLIISFAFWGVSFYTNQDVDPVIASVNGKDIKLRYFQNTLNNVRQQMRRTIQGELSKQEEEFIKEEVLQQTINSEILSQFTQDVGLYVSDKQLIAAIQNLPIFHDENGFNRDIYEQSIFNMGMRSEYFEQQLRLELLSEHLQLGFSETLFAVKSKTDDLLRLQSQMRDISYGIIRVDDFIKNIEVNDADIDSFYQKNNKKYQAPEQVKISYIEVDIEKIIKIIDINEDLIKDYYNEHKDKYDTPEQRSLTRLFVRIEDKATDEDEAIVRDTIETAKKMAETGKDFEEIIKHFTEKGKGKLEFTENTFVSKGVLDESIDTFLFAADKNEISDILEVKNELNIIKVKEIKGGANSYESVVKQVENDYRREQAELQFFELSEQLATLSYENEDSLEPASEAIGLPVENTNFFSRNEHKEGLLANNKVIKTSFDPNMISSGINSDLVELDNNHIVVLRVIAHKAPKIKPLNEVREKLIVDIKEQLANSKVRAIGESIVKRLQGGEQLADIEAELNINWEHLTKVKRSDINIPRAVLRNAFKLKKPSDKNISISGQTMGSGDYAVVIVNVVHYPSLSETTLKEQEETNIALKRIQLKAEWSSLLKAARADSKIKVYRDRL